MYKDKSKQKEAAKIRQQRRRDAKKGKGVTKGVTLVTPGKGVTSEPQQGIPQPITPEQAFAEIPAKWHTPPDVVERLAKTGSVTYTALGVPISWQGKNGHGERITLNLGPYKSAGELAGDEFNRVSLPGDSDYEGKTPCNPTASQVQA